MKKVVRSDSPPNYPDGPWFELIEHGQILLLTQKGDVDFQKAHYSIEGILYYLDRADHVIHVISDMTDAKVLPEANKIRFAKNTQRELAHPMLGIQGMVMRDKSKDYTLEKIMNEYNITVSRDKIVSPNGEYKRHVIYFSNLEEAKTFVKTFVDIWKEE